MFMYSTLLTIVVYVIAEYLAYEYQGAMCILIDSCNTIILVWLRDTIK